MTTEAPARTSLLIAAATLMEDRVGDVADLDRRIARAALSNGGASGRRLLGLAERRLGRAALRAIEAVMLPGLSHHYRWRKRRIAAWVEEEIANGIKQLIVLGAGFDALACRMALAHASLTVIEIERAPSSALKRRILSELQVLPDNLHCCPADLARESVAAALATCRGFDPHRPTLVVAEGLLMYLAPDEVRDLMQSLEESLIAPVDLIATAMNRDVAGRIGFTRESRWVRRWLRRHGEPFQWGADAMRLSSTLLQLRMTIDQLADPLTPKDPDPCPGEWLFRGRITSTPSSSRPAIAPMGARLPSFHHA